MDSAHTMAVHRFLLRLSLAVGGLFAWIIIFHALYVSGETTQGALLLTVFAFAYTQLCILFLTPLAGKNTQHGTSRSMILAGLALSAAFLWLASSAAGVFGSTSLNVWWGIVGFCTLFALYRGLYWIPYSAIGISVRSAWNAQTRFLFEILLALAPAASAVVVTQASGAWLVLVGASFFAFCSSVALVSVRDTYERFSFTYASAFAVLFSREQRTLLRESVLEGMQGAGLLFFWPLTIFILFFWSYLKLGLVLSITLLLALLFRRLLQKYIRRLAVSERSRARAAISGSIWVLRLISMHPIAIVVADSLTHTLLPSRRLGIDPVSFEQAADSNHFIDEYTALKEMGMALGRVSVCVVFMLTLTVAEPLVALALALILVAISSIIHAYRTAAVLT